MVHLRRTVRFAVGAAVDPERAEKGVNGFGGSPSMQGLGAHYELDVTCGGVPDETTGYLVNIKVIDDAARSAAVPAIASAFHERPQTEPGEILPSIAETLAGTLQHELIRLSWRLSPTYAVEIDMADPTVVLIRQKFDFAASHRLHCASLTDEQNRSLFGKCNSPSGHGHNYQVEPVVAIPATPPSHAEPFTLRVLERLTEDTIIQHFDHKHLNLDTEEFGDHGVNPSVEHIARVCFERLRPEVARHGGELRALTVWETDRTSCTYPG
ncbi:MAG: 6-carboxytetrahydropterin synthase [Phycisphaerales bacterium]